MHDHSSMETTTFPDEALPLNKAARCLRVPARWMRGEVDARRLPALRAGSVILIHVPTVAKLLANRAKQTGRTEVARD